MTMRSTRPPETEPSTLITPEGVLERQAMLDACPLHSHRSTENPMNNLVGPVPRPNLRRSRPVDAFELE